MLHCDYESGVLHVQKLWLNFSPLGCKRVAGGQLLSQAFKAICRTYQSIRSSPSSSSPHQVCLQHLSHCRLLEPHDCRGESRQEITSSVMIMVVIRKRSKGFTVSQLIMFAGWLHQRWQRESQSGEGGNHQDPHPSWFSWLHLRQISAPGPGPPHAPYTPPDEVREDPSQHVPSNTLYKFQ